MRQSVPAHRSEPALNEPAPALTATHRDHGLVRGIGVTGLAASIVNSVVGSGVFTLPAAVALTAGPAAPAAYILCAILMAGIVLCFAAAGSRVPTSGGAYGTVEAAFGPAAGFVVGVLLVVSDLLASGGIAAAIADLLISLAPPLAAPPWRVAIIAATYLCLVVANIVGVRTTARLISGATLVKLLPLAGFALLGLFSLARPHPFAAPPPVTLHGFGRALILTLFAFEGMETALGASGEVRTPNRTLPRALFAAMLFVLALYLGVQLTAQHLLGDAALAASAAPLADAAARISQPLRLVMLGGAVLSMFAWMASDVLGTSRMIFALARDRRLPAWLADLSPRSQIPAKAVAAYAAVAALLAASGSFLELVVLSSLATVVIYIMVCLAAVRLAQRRIALAGPPLRVPALPLAAAIGLAGMVFMLVAARWQERAGLAALVAASLLLYAATQRRRQGRAAALPPAGRSP